MAKEKEIQEKTINVDTLDPETLEVEKLIDPEDVKDEPIEVPNYEEEIVKIIRGNSSPKVIRSKLEDYHDNNIADALELLKKTERQKRREARGVSEPDAEYDRLKAEPV